MKQKHVLIFAAHPDDAELGMGGTIKHISDKGFKVKVVDLTSGEPTPCGTPEKRKEESANAAGVLGFTREILEYKNRELVFDIEKRNHIAGIIRKYRPQVVYSHYAEDSHPDHSQASRIVEDAVFAAQLTKSSIPGEPFRVEKMYYYFAVHLKKIVVPDFFIVLSEDEHQAKMKALECYRSQFIDNKQNDFVFDYIKTRDKYWGFYAGCEYAEGFKSREEIGIDDIRI